MDEFVFEMTDELIAEAKDIGMKRSGSMNHADTKNSKNMTPNKAPWWRHYIGALGEVAFREITGQEMPNIYGKGDEGNDFPCGSNIKSSDHPNCNLLIHKKTAWDRKRAERYILVQIKLPKVIFLGEMTETKINNLIKIVGDNIYRDYGRGLTLTIPRRMLDPVDWSRYEKEKINE